MTSEQASVFAANLRRLKKDSGMSWREVGAQIGHKNSRYMLALAAGDFEPRVTTVNKLAEVFGVTSAEMLEAHDG